MKEEDTTRHTGLTSYQSRAYLALKNENGLTPSQIAYRSGVPNSGVCHGQLVRPSHFELIWCARFGVSCLF